jgi:hypothetical protein
MAAIATAFGRAYVARVVLRSRHRRDADSGAYVAPHDYVPSSTADLWKGARPRPCR